MRAAVAMLACAAVGVTASCAPAETVEIVEVPANWRHVEAGTWSFQFPQDRELSGLDDICGGRSAPSQNCPVFIDSVFFSHASPDLTLHTKDGHGPDGPSDWGDPIKLNDVPAYRLELEDGSWQYLLTDRAGGLDAAVRFSWPTKESGRIGNPREQALMWATCRTEAACQTARAILASARFRQRG